MGALPDVRGALTGRCAYAGMHAPLQATVSKQGNLDAAGLSIDCVPV